MDHLLSMEFRIYRKKYRFADLRYKTKSASRNLSTNKKVILLSFERSLLISQLFFITTIVL